MTDDQKPAGDIPADQKPADQKSAEPPPADQKPADQKAADQTEPGRKADEPPAQSKAPEKYALTLPESGRLDATDLAYIEDVARKAGWTNEEAQAAIAEQDAAIQAQSDRFLAETTQDKDYGGDKLAASQQLAKAAIDRLRPIGHPRREAFLKFLNRGGAGNHIEVVSALADLGKLMAEDTTVGGNSGSGGEPKTLAQKMYPNQAP